MRVSQLVTDPGGGLRAGNSDEVAFLITPGLGIQIVRLGGSGDQFPVHLCSVITTALVGASLSRKPPFDL